MTTTMTVSEVKRRLDALVADIANGETRILVEQGGNPVVAIISAADFERLSRLEREREERFRVVDELRAAFKDVSPEEIERETDRIIAGIRAEEAARASAPAGSR